MPVAVRVDVRDVIPTTGTKLKIYCVAVPKFKIAPIVKMWYNKNWFTMPFHWHESFLQTINPQSFFNSEDIMVLL